VQVRQDGAVAVEKLPLRDTIDYHDVGLHPGFLHLAKIV
jgi:hypothetical protein